MRFALVPRESIHARRSGEAIVTEGPETEAPSYDREAGVRAILEQEDTVLGRVYLYDVQGLTPSQIAEAEGNQGVAFVYNYRLQLQALLTGDDPESPWAARSVAAKLRKWLKTLDLDPRLRDDLTTFE